MLGALFFPFLLALLVTMVLIPPLMKTALWTGFLDEPDNRKVHSHAIPRVGGLALVTGTLLTIFFWLPMSNELTSLLLGIGILLVFGAWDDRNGLNYRIKFISQFVSALVVVFYGDILIRLLPLFDTFDIPDYCSVPLTVFVIVGITNAINLADGLDGLSGGKTLLIFICMAFMANQIGDLDLALLNMIFVGAILGFLRFNTHPAQVFMGDAGSQVLGFTSVVLALLLTQNPGATFSPALPMLLFALPAFDTLSVIIQRIALGRSPFAPDQNHVHHRLLALGFSHYQSVLLVYFIQAVLVTSAYFLRYDNDALIVSIFIVFCLAMTVVVYMSHRGMRILNRGNRHSSANEISDASNLVVPVIAKLIGILLATLLILSAAMPMDYPVDVLLAASGLLLVSVLLFLFKPEHKLLWLRIAAYLACAFSIYFFEVGSGETERILPIINTIYFLLAVLVVAGIAFPDQQFFRITPLDFLIIFLCLIVPGISYLNDSSIPVAMLSARLVVMMYACEFILTIKKTWCWEVAFGVFAMLLILIVRWFV